MTVRLFVLLLGSLLGALPLAAQSDDEMAEVFNRKFQLAAPDTSFIPMEDDAGWEEPATDAKVICMAMPVPYERMAEDLEALNSEEGQKVLEKSVRVIGGVSGLLMLLEFTPMAGEDTDSTYSLMFARPYGDVSLLLSAQYPKSEHSRLYDKILSAFATVRQIKE